MLVSAPRHSERAAEPSSACSCGSFRRSPPTGFCAVLDRTLAGDLRCVRSPHGPSDCISMKQTHRITVLCALAALMVLPNLSAQLTTGELWVGPVVSNPTQYKIFTKQTASNAGFFLEGTGTDSLHIFSDGTNIVFATSGD